jgi:hypothetical protein
VPDEKIGDQIEVETAAHPPRTDSPEYLRSRKWLMGVVTGGCYICGGPVDLSHPDAPADAKGLQDHHGGGLYVRDVLVGFNLMPLEWSMGWGADPSRVTAFVQQLVDAGLVVGGALAWVDSTFNANVKLCAPHHVGHQTTHTPDANGHEAVGIHNAPWPVLAAQAVWDWSRGDMFGGTTGTVTVAPHPSVPGAAVVTYVHPAHPESLKVGQTLPATHGVAKALHAGAAAAA